MNIKRLFIQFVIDAQFTTISLFNFNNFKVGERTKTCILNVSLV